jgi:3-hydroxybutyryl-CoA dehydrogenase
LLRAFARRTGQVPLVLKKEHARYLMNDFLEAINSTAAGLFGSGVASVEDIDRAFMIVMGVPRGPFAMLDFVGLDTVWHIMETNARLARSEEALAAADEFKKQYIDKGLLGVKAVKGFYTHPNPAYERPGFLTGEA